MHNFFFRLSNQQYKREKASPTAKKPEKETDLRNTTYTPAAKRHLKLKNNLILIELKKCDDKQEFLLIK